ncbi:DUF551 domain-containing protein [Escherichia coli]|uniref:DUF551 domain-containing protein n=1 Tax=Escherichia coli TaxID=562 RepID=UPI000C86CED0|nr:DUF551 domain-containing protein [Escherichia coli]AUO43090.1 hypothetical protein C0R78_22395 [Escherichia coli]HBU7565736.1 DUF551 domain-containing protein [Enterobacter cloacae]
MTTNNHPAHGPVSPDRLHQIREILSKAAEQSDGGNLGYAMADAVKVIDGAIAAFGAEPAPVDIEMLATVLRNAPLAPSDRQGRPRAPVVPEECKEAPAYVKALTKEGAYIYGFNACRAAMLQGVDGNSPVIPDGWVACSERMPEEGSKVIVFRPRASESNDPPVKTATYKGGREYYHGFDCYCEPTHWMPLPAAPQQEA